MPRQVYRCPEHGEFEKTVPFGEDVPREAWCPEILVGKTCNVYPCWKVSPWVPQAPAIHVKDGTTPPR